MLLRKQPGHRASGTTDEVRVNWSVLMEALLTEKVPASLAALRLALKPHIALLNNAVSVAGGMVVNSALGFAYWWIAARFFSLETAGLTAATVSITSLIGLSGQLGLGTILISKAFSFGKKQAGLISAALIVSSGMAILLGIAFLVIAWFTSLGLGGITGSRAGIALFVLGCGTSCLIVMLNSAFIGLLRSTFAMAQETALSFCKLALLALVAVKWGSTANEVIVFATWIGAQAISALIFAAALWKLTRESVPVPHFGVVRGFMRVSLSHHLLDLVIQTPILIMPFLVTAALSPAVNAAFNSAWTMLRITIVLPAALSTIIFAIGDKDRNAYASRLRFSLLLLIVSGAGVVICLTSLADFILGIFNPEYPAIAANSLRVLSITFIAVSVSSLYLTIQRLNGQMIRATYVFAAGGFAGLVFACIGAQFYGLLGLCLGWTFAVTLQASYAAKLVLQEAWGARRQARGVTQHVEAPGEECGVPEV